MCISSKDEFFGPRVTTTFWYCFLTFFLDKIEDMHDYGVCTDALKMYTFRPTNKHIS